MGSRNMRLLLLGLTVMLIEGGMAVDHNVGDSTGWDTTSDLQTWQSARTFRVGDTLTFKYSSMHNVMEVPNKSDYDSCQSNNLIQLYSDGSTNIALDTPGKRFFICGTPGHCDMGMKLLVDTAASSPPPTLSPPSSPNKSTPADLSPPPPKSAPSALSPPPPKSAPPALLPPPALSPSPAPTSSSRDDEIKNNNNGPTPMAPSSVESDKGIDSRPPSAATATPPHGCIVGLFVSIVMVLAHF